MTTRLDACLIEAVHIDGFGPFHNQRIQLGPGLVIVEGPNEAGKTGLLQFMLYALFPERTDGRFEALAGGRLGGRVFMRAGGRDLTVERHGRDAPVVWDDGRRDDAGVQAVVGGVDRGLFGRVYAFSPAELLTLDALGDDQVRERLFAGAVAGAGRDVQKATSALKARREALWRPRGACVIRDIDTRISACRQQLHEARMRMAELGSERGRVATIHDEMQQLLQQRGRLAAEGMRLRAARQAWPVRVELQAHEAECRALEALGLPTAEQYRDVGELVSRDAALGQAVAAARRELHDKEQELGGLAVDEALVAVGPTARMLEAEKGEVLVLAADVAELGAAVDKRSDLLAANVVAAGLGGGALDLAQVRAGPTFAAALRRAAADVERLDAVMPALTAAEAEAKREADAVRAAREALGAWREGAGDDDLPVAGVPEGVQARVVALRQARTAVARRDALVAVASGSEGLGTARWLVVLGLVALVGVLGFAAFGSGGVGPGGVVGAGIGVVLVVWGLWLARAARQKVADAMVHRAQVAEPIQAAGFAGDVDTAVVNDALDGALDALRRAEVAVAAGGSGAINARARLEARLTEAEKTWALARDKAGRLAVDAGKLEHAANAWMAALRDAGLPTTLPAGGVDALLREVAACQAELRDIELLRARVGGARTRVGDWLERARGLVAAIGREVPADVRALGAAISDIVAGCAVAEDRKRKADVLSQARERLLRVVHEAEAAHREVRQALEEATSGVDDVASWLKRFEQHETFRRVCDEKKLVLKQMLGEDDSDGDSHAAHDWAEHTDPVMRDMRIDEVEDALRVIEKQRETLLDERGRLGQRIAEAARDAVIAEQEQVLGVLTTEREAAVAELSELMVAEELLRAALAAFREKHEPGVFRVAAEHMRTATAGAWVGVNASEDQRELTVIDAEGRSRESAVLSRGTRDLLYIALRLGLAHEQRPGGLLLPLVLDDVLVNLDPERAAGLARVLASEAKERQVIVLTCRPETVEALQEADGAATVVRLERWAGAAGPPAGVVRKKGGDVSAETLAVANDGPKRRRKKVDA